MLNFISFTKKNEIGHVAKCGKYILAPRVELYHAWHRETHFMYDSVNNNTSL